MRENLYEAQRRELILDRYRSGNNDAYFRVCRRRAATPIEKIAPWDALDTCKQCGHEVIYDSRDSTSSTPHICLLCAELNHQVKSLNALAPDKPREEDVAKQEFSRRVEKAISQNRHSEIPKRRKLYPRPTQSKVRA